MKNYILTIAMFFVAFSMQAQHEKVRIDPSVQQLKKANTNPLNNFLDFQVHANEINHEITKNKWNRKIIRKSIKHDVPTEIQILKDQKSELKKATAIVADDLKEPAEIDERPGIGINFEANWFDGGTPPDNSIAISNDGFIVTVANSTVEYYNQYGEFLYFSSFDDFFNDDDLTGSIYDPVVLYDSGSDRFIMIVLHGTSSYTSKVLTCFSKTNNPQDGWWWYKLTGNPLDDNDWFDYPKIGISTNELFITGNLFSNSGSFQESVIYQIPKNDGYNGDNISWVYWYNLSDDPFTLVPASYGQAGNYGPGIYLISTRYSDQNYKLFDITDDLDHDPEINIYLIDAEFTIPGDALQYGTDCLLDAGDPRALSAFYLNGYIHFVFHSERNESYYSGLNYNRLKINTLSNTSSIYGLDEYDYNYPSVASYGVNQYDKSVMICFLRSASNIYPEVRVVGVDHNGNWTYSTTVKQGDTYVDVYEDNGVTRWGDYSGISRKQNAPSPEAWVSGGFGTWRLGEHAFDTWIAQVTEFYVDTKEFIEPTKSVLQVYPNPSSGSFNVVFENDTYSNINISLYNLNGKRIKILYNDITKPGTYEFSFNENSLPQGLYVIKIKSNNKTIEYEKVIVF